MSSARFPARKPDGSFCVEVGIELSARDQTDLVPRIQAWVGNAWLPHHSTWTREWRTGPNFSASGPQVLKYRDEFTASPEIALGSSSELQLRLKGAKTAKYWKDWLVARLVPDLKAAFPGIGNLLYIRDCTDSSG